MSGHDGSGVGVEVARLSRIGDIMSSSSGKFCVLYSIVQLPTLAIE